MSPSLSLERGIPAGHPPQLHDKGVRGRSVGRISTWRWGASRARVWFPTGPRRPGCHRDDGRGRAQGPQEVRVAAVRVPVVVQLPALVGRRGPVEDEDRNRTRDRDRARAVPADRALQGGAAPAGRVVQDDLRPARRDPRRGCSRGLNVRSSRANSARDGVSCRYSAVPVREEQLDAAERIHRPGSAGTRRGTSGRCSARSRSSPDRRGARGAVQHAHVLAREVARILADLREHLRPTMPEARSTSGRARPCAARR
jgi:hypothetical protein